MYATGLKFGASDVISDIIDELQHWTNKVQGIEDPVSHTELSYSPNVTSLISSREALKHTGLVILAKHTYTVC